MARSNHPTVYRVNDRPGEGSTLIREVLHERGWVEYDENADQVGSWGLWWRTGRFTSPDYTRLLPWQCLNHFPNSTLITRKDKLARALRRMKLAFPGAFTFSPQSFILPGEYTRFLGIFSQLNNNNNTSPADPDDSNANKHEKVWICKPSDSSRGRGIFLFRDLSELQYDFNAVIQRYIPNPLLVSGYKFDLRIYVAVTSFRPLHIYVYQEGLARFGTQKYKDSDMGDLYAHLTNTSINKNSPSYSAEKDRVGAGCKWTLTQLRMYLHSIGLDDQLLFSKIVNIIILTLILQMEDVPLVLAGNCFELYGFDILVDENLKPWLLEVNFSPALSHDCWTDVKVKKPMLHDLMDLIGLPEFHPPVIISNGVTINFDQNLVSKRKSKSLNRIPSFPVSSPRASPSSMDSILGESDASSDELSLPQESGGSGLPLILSPEQRPPLPKKRSEIFSRSTQRLLPSRPLLIDNDTEKRLHRRRNNTVNQEQHQIKRKPEFHRISSLPNVEQHVSTFRHAHLPQKVGEFYLVFPFNSVTRRNADHRQLIQEVQQLLKRSLENGKNGFTSRAAKLYKDTASIWSPLRSTEENPIPHSNR